MNYDFDDAERREAGISIHSGFPNPAADRQLRALDLNQLLAPRSASTFLFRIRGNQGRARGIVDGDIAIVDRAEAPRQSDLLLWHNGQRFRLSSTAQLDPGATIWGVVTGLVRHYRTGQRS